MNNLIFRPTYIEKIKPFIGKNIIKVLIGSRRVGKTMLLKQLITEIQSLYIDSCIVYINMEEHHFKKIKNSDDLYRYVVENINHTKQNFIFIDEIQEIKGFEIALRELLVKQYDIYCTGSNAKMLSGDIATYLSGRYIEFQINSLSYSEFLLFHNLTNSNDSMNKYIKYGGLPYLIHLPLTEDIVYGYLRSVYNSIILKDVVARFNIRDIEFLERLIEYVSENLGCYISSNKIIEFLKSQQISMSVNTVLNYLKYLNNAFFIQKVKRFDIVGKKRFEVNDKFYFLDLGLKHTIFPFRPDDIGKVFENLVYKKLIELNYNVFIGKLNQYEIDFVAKKNDRVIYIQVAYLLSSTEVMNREFGNLKLINDNYRKIVVSADEFLSGNNEGIEFLNMRDFLMLKEI